MNARVAEIDLMPEADAAQLFRSCCGSSKWVDAMVAQRPFGSSGAILTAADEVWRSCSEIDWLEAFSHHPRIGGGVGAMSETERARSWSDGEQAAVRTASATVQEELAELNREYETRFGHIYIVCATGRSAEEMLAIARTRMENDPAAELRVAAEEQRKITQLRLRKILEGEQ